MSNKLIQEVETSIQSSKERLIPTLLAEVELLQNQNKQLVNALKKTDSDLQRLYGDYQKSLNDWFKLNKITKRFKIAFYISLTLLCLVIASIFYLGAM